jgi:hypothetical protein
MDGISDSYYPNNEKNARMRDVSPAYNFGGSQYRKILGISDPAFSGGDEFVAYAEYLNERTERNRNFSAADQLVIEAQVRKNLAGNGIIEKPWWAGYVSSTLPWPGETMDYGDSIFTRPTFLTDNTVKKEPNAVERLAYVERPAQTIAPT